LLPSLGWDRQYLGEGRPSRTLEFLLSPAVLADDFQWSVVHIDSMQNLSGGDLTPLWSGQDPYIWQWLFEQLTASSSQHKDRGQKLPYLPGRDCVSCQLEMDANLYAWEVNAGDIQFGSVSLSPLNGFAIPRGCSGENGAAINTMQFPYTHSDFYRDLRQMR
jgi:hypothetical protein